MENGQAVDYHLLMQRMIARRVGAAVVAGLIVTQAALFWLSLQAGAFSSLSVLCTGPRSSDLSWLFGLLHIAFVPLATFGLLSFGVPRFRATYIVLVSVALLMLPLQIALVDDGVLLCDGP